MRWSLASTGTLIILIGYKSAFGALSKGCGLNERQLSGKGGGGGDMRL